MSNKVDLNSDIGELIDRNNDSRIVELVSSVNISCGVHVGATDLTRRTIALAANAGVAIGAHPGLPGAFGRSEKRIDSELALNEVLRQLEQFNQAAERAGVTVSHVKPHGALYNQAETDINLAHAIVEASSLALPHAMIYCLAGGQLAAIANRRGLRTVGEFFADREYESSGQLRARSNPGAVIDDPDLVVGRVAEAVTMGRVLSHDGTLLDIEFESICVHGDTTSAIRLIEAINSTLQATSITIERPR